MPTHSDVVKLLIDFGALVYLRSVITLPCVREREREREREIEREGALLLSHFATLAVMCCRPLT
jgi:hypothetical protein